MAADEERGVDVVESVLTTASNSDRTQGNSPQGGRDADGLAGGREPTLEEQQPTQEDDQHDQGLSDGRQRRDLCGQRRSDEVAKGQRGAPHGHRDHHRIVGRVDDRDVVGALDRPGYPPGSPPRRKEHSP